MQDKLKQYIEDHREELDVHEPREGLWEGIGERLQQGRKQRLWQRLALAASLLLMVTCSTWLIISKRQDTRLAQTATLPQTPIREAEAYFTAIVQMKDAELSQYCSPQPELCNEFEKDMSTLSKAYQQLKQEYAAGPDKATILQAMMTNLHMQVALISRQLQIMESVKRKKEETNII